MKKKNRELKKKNEDIDNMAKINGLELRELRTFKDHEDFDIYQGDIYLEGIKIGCFSDDYMNGPKHIKLVPELDYVKLNNKIVEINQGLEDPWPKSKSIAHDQRPWGNIFKDFCLELIIEDLIMLQMWENDFHKLKKKDKDITLVIVTDGDTDYYYSLHSCDNNEAIQYCKQNISKELEFNNHKSISFFAFRTDKDFDLFDHVVIKDFYRNQKEINELKKVYNYTPKIDLQNKKNIKSKKQSREL